jgi:mannose-6-phosphate isomerase-like protein (cupin superfamily)
MNRILQRCFAAALTFACIGPAVANDALNIKPLAERTVETIPDGTLYWRIENFPDASSASAAAGPWSLVAEAAGKVWLFTLTPDPKAAGAGTKVAEVGPIPRVAAPRYLLRINQATGAPGSRTPVHTHPGSEAFYVLRGEQSIRGPADTLRVRVGQAEAGRGAGVPMQVSSSGETDLLALVMFVVDATKPFSSPATM